MKYIYIQEVNGKKLAFLSKPKGDCEKIELSNSVGIEPDHDELQEHVRALFTKSYKEEPDPLKLANMYFAFREYYMANDWCYMKGNKKVPITNWKLKATQWFAPKLHLMKCYKKQTEVYGKQQVYNNLK